MAKNVFISFRFSDGHLYKDDLCKAFDKYSDTVDFSEDIDRSNCSEYTIKGYLYSKLKRSSVTIVLLTPEAVNHKRNWQGKYDDWMYDEIRYSLEDRTYNHTNGLIAVYTPEAEHILIEHEDDTIFVKTVDNLFRANMMNVKNQYKKCNTQGRYDSNLDSYCSLVPFDVFKRNLGYYIDLAVKKRENIYKYNIIKQ